MKLSLVKKFFYFIFPLIVIISFTIAVRYRQNLKSNAQEAISNPQEIVEGNLRILIEDDFENNVSNTKYFVQKDNLEMDEIEHIDLLGLKPGTRIRVNGNNVSNTSLKVDPSQNIENIQIVSTGEANSQTNPTIGTKKIALIGVEFTNIPYSKPTTTDALSVLNGTVKDFYTQNSFQKFTISGDAYGKYNIGAHTCDSYEIATRAIVSADPYVNFNNYGQIVLVYEQEPSCNRKNGFGYLETISFETAEGQKQLLVSAATSNAWGASK